ncbi:MAG: HAD-IIA family hydrolase [Verrucomicrobiales bacterium]|nr:HAD-IIA family hydrolase [Verrucomicrobiales bacterium]
MAAVTPEILVHLRRIRHVALDMDGTIYKGKTLFPFTNGFLARIAGMGIGYSFLTNNSSKSVADYAAHLRRMGVEAGDGRIHTSTLASLAFLRLQHPSLRRLFVVGTASMTAEVRAAGFDLVDDDPEAVLLGFDPALNFTRLCQAAYWLTQGRLFIATHPDRICPSDEPAVLIDCGAVCAALQSATGRVPDAVPGKPAPEMLLGLCTRIGCAPDEMAMVGDRLYTDIEMARRAGALGVLVLSGEATAAEAAAAEPPADLVLRDLNAFGDLLATARNGAHAPSAQHVAQALPDPNGGKS